MHAKNSMLSAHICAGESLTRLCCAYVSGRGASEADVAQRFQDMVTRMPTSNCPSAILSWIRNRNLVPLAHLHARPEVSEEHWHHLKMLTHTCSRQDVNRDGKISLTEFRSRDLPLPRIPPRAFDTPNTSAPRPPALCACSAACSSRPW